MSQSIGERFESWWKDKVDLAHSTRNDIIKEAAKTAYIEATLHCASIVKDFYDKYSKIGGCGDYIQCSDYILKTVLGIELDISLDDFHAHLNLANGDYKDDSSRCTKAPQ